MFGRGAQGLLVAVLGLALWHMGGATAAEALRLDQPNIEAADADTVVAHVVAGGSGLGEHAAALSRLPRVPTAAARLVLPMLAVLALAGALQAVRNRPYGPTSRDVPIRSALFAGPGRLRGPPVV